MKKRVLSLLLILVMLVGMVPTTLIRAGASKTESASADGKSIDLYLIAGQSNASGSSKITDAEAAYNIAPELETGFSNVLYAGKPGLTSTYISNWEPTKLGMGYSKNTIGAEAGMAIALSEYYNAETGKVAGIFKYAHGGSPLSGNNNNDNANWVSPSYAAANGWNYGEAPCGIHYAEFLKVFREKIAALIELGYTEISIKGLYWMQGEADRTDVNPNNQATYYSTALKYLISDLRFDLASIMNEIYSGDAGASDMPFYIGAISESFGLSNSNVINTNRKFIELQKSIAAEVSNCYFIDNSRYKLSIFDSNTNSTITLGSDNYHWNQADMLDMGQTVGYNMYHLGVIPSDYENVREYPFILFNEGRFVGAAKTWSAANNLSRVTLDGAKGSTVTMYMRSDVTTDTVPSADAICYMNGTVVLDLGGNTLTGATTVFSAVTAGYTGSYDTVFKVQNGTICASDGAIFTAEASGDFAKKLSLDFDNVKLTVDGAKRSNGFCANTSVGIGPLDVTVTFNLCVLEICNILTEYCLFDFASNDNASVSINLNGGDILADETLVNVTLFEGDSKDSMVFGKGTTAQYTVLRVPSSYTPPAIGGQNNIGDYVLFGNPANQGDLTAYTISESERETKYGIVPVEYADGKAYPFVVFSNGEFVAVYSKLIDNAGGTSDEGTTYNGCYGINSAFEMARALVYCTGGNAQIVMRADYTNTDIFNNISNFDGEIIFDLGRFTLTHNGSDPLLAIDAKASWNGSAVILPSNIILRNGTLKTKSALVGFSTNATENYTKDYLDGVHKIINCSFENLKVIYTSNKYSALIAHPNSVVGNTLKQADFNITLNNCTLDASGVTTNTVALVIGTDYAQGQSLNDVNVVINGGRIITEVAKIVSGTFNTVTGDSGDSLTFGKYDSAYTEFVGTPGLESDNIIFREEFTGSINTEANKAASSNGLFVQMGGGSTYTLENNTLKYINRVGSDFVDLQFFHDSIAKNIGEDFVLSVWLKPDTDKLSINDWAYRYYVNGSGSWVKIPFKVTNGCYVVNGNTYSGAKLNAGEWSLIEIVFHYEASATSATGETGAFTSYSFMLNGEVISTCAAPAYTHKINHLRVIQYANATYSIDDLTLAKGTETLFYMPSTVPSEFIFREEFSSGVNTEANKVTEHDGYFVQVGGGSTYVVEDNTLKFTNRATNDFVDLQFYHNAVKKDMKSDFVLSVWIKPDTDDLSLQGWNYRYYVNGSGSWITVPFKILNGCYVINGTTYSDAKLAAGKWALVETTYHYDSTAVSTTGELGAFTSYSFMLNGQVITSSAAPAFAHRVNHFRVLQYTVGTYSMDDLTVATGARSLINEPSTVPAEIIFREEFTGSVNTDAEKAPASNGLLASMGGGSTYTLESNTLKYTSRVGSDFIDLQFYHSTISMNLDRSFVLSFWIKPDTDNLSINDWNYRYYLNGTASWVKIPFRVTNGCYVVNGSTYSDAKLTAGEWSLIEIVFHYDSIATSETGDTGAFTSYSFMLNGETIATCAATTNTHKINHFRIIHYANATYAIDDLTLATGTASLIDTVSAYPTESCAHNYDNACDADCNACGDIRQTQHTGGSATCITKAQCSICGVEYGDFGGHTPSEDDGDCTTDITCLECGAITTEGESTHTGGNATCTSKARCDVCDKEYGEFAVHTPNEDDGDCTTDITCSECGTITTAGESAHIGGNATCIAKARCDVCGKEYGDFADHTPNEDDGDCTTDITCSECGTITTAGESTHIGGNATCTAKARCDVCGKEYGEFAVHTPNEDDGDCTTDITCSECGTITTAGESTHIGGNATCTSKARCDVCGKEYGELADHNFGKATCTSKAKCSICNAETGELKEHNDTDNNDKCDICEVELKTSGGAPIVLIVSLAIIVVLGGGFALYWFVIRKKKAKS